MQPYILMTVYNRYFELVANLKYIHRYLISEFPVKPKIYIVWARSNEQPEYEYVFDSLLKNNYIDRAFPRDTIYAEGIMGGITWPESINIYTGLGIIGQEYEHGYVIINTADVFAQSGTYKMIDKNMRKGINVYGFNWETPYTRDSCVCTNFVAVSANHKYWPPV
jgi:hypothetical protein